MPSCAPVRGGRRADPVRGRDLRPFRHPRRDEMRHPYRPLLLAALLVLGAVSLPLLVTDWRLEFDASTEVLLAGDERAEATYERLQDMLDGLTVLAVIYRDDQLLTNEGVQRLGRLGDRIQKLPGIVDVKSLTHSWRPVRKPGFSLDPKELIGLESIVPRRALSEAEWDEVRAFVLEFPLARDLFVSSDGEWALTMISTSRPLPDAAAVRALEADMWAALEPLEGRVEDLHLLGFPFIEEEVRAAVQDDVARFAWLAGGLAILILLVTFRSLSVLLAVSLFLLAGLASLPALVHLSGVTVNLYSGILVPLISGLQLTFLTHFFSAFQFALSRGKDRAEALHTAIAMIQRPSFIAAVTTLIGLCSLLVCDVGLVRQFGALGAGAVVAVYLITFVPLWLLRACSRRERVEGDATPLPEHGRMEGLVHLLSRRRRLVLAGSVLFVLACLPGVFTLRSDVRATEFLSEQSPSRQGLMAQDEHLGGVNVFRLEVECAADGGAWAPETLEFLETMRTHVRQVPGVTNVYTYSLILGLMNQVWTGDDSGRLTMPATPMLAQLFTSGLRMLKWQLLESFVDPAGRRTELLLRTRDMPAGAYLDMLDGVMEFAEDEVPDGVTLSVQRGIHDLLEADRRLVASQRASLVVCAGAIVLALALLFWSVYPALLTLAVNIPALAAVAGLMGYAGLPLNSITVMVAAVVLGIAVDDSIHWLSFHRQHRDRFDDPMAAVRWTLARKLKPVACTTAILICGLSVLSFSSFPPVADFGVLTSAALAVSLASVMLLLPAMVLLVGRREG